MKKPPSFSFQVFFSRLFRHLNKLFPVEGRNVYLSVLLLTDFLSHFCPKTENTIRTNNLRDGDKPGEGKIAGRKGILENSFFL